VRSYQLSYAPMDTPIIATQTSFDKYRRFMLLPIYRPVLLSGQAVGRGGGDGAAATVGVGVAVSGLGDGSASIGVRVG
jgi:hypothetical protein